MNSNSKKLDGKVAVVTGASKGIGAGIAKHLAAEGATAVVNYSSSKEGADKVVDEITKHGGKAMAVQADVAKKKDIDRLFAQTKNAFGRLTFWSTMPACTGRRARKPDGGAFHKHFDVNVLGLLLASQAALKYFGQEGGSIINISSGASTLTPPNTSVYSATKAAVNAITRTLAKELGPRNIRVNAINPGMVMTEGVVAGGFDKSDFRKQLESQTPLGRIGQTEDIAPAAVFLASQDSAWITGETLVIAGGLR